jgi:nicotinamidase-related amidase
LAPWATNTGLPGSTAMAQDDAPHKNATAPFRDAPRDGTALLIMDMITELDFPGTGRMLDDVNEVADVILRLRDEADAARIPVIYVNDNFGEWHSERSRLVERALAVKGHGFVDRIKPRDDDYFIIKPQFSGFYSTNLPVLLPKLGVSRLVLAGIATDICILFTAGDAHMRDYRMWVPADAVAAETRERHRWALEIMKTAMNADVRPTNQRGLEQWSSEDQR